MLPRCRVVHNGGSKRSKRSRKQTHTLYEEKIGLESGTGKIQRENTDEYIVKRGDEPKDESQKNNAREMETMEHTHTKR